MNVMMLVMKGKIAMKRKEGRVVDTVVNAK